MSDVIAAGQVVVVEFTLTGADGTVLEETGPGQSFAYLHGHANLPATLEGVLAGLAPGDTFDERIEAAFGTATGTAQSVHKRDIPKEVRKQVAPGGRFPAQDSEGNTHWLWVTEVKGSRVTVTTDHPLAGQTVRFTGTVHRIRPPTASELEHGHAHGADGHHHAH